MSLVIKINERGTLTLPKSLRKKLGLTGKGEIIADEGEEGIILRAGETFPLEIYSKERLEEFHRSNEEELEGYGLE